MAKKSNRPEGLMALGAQLADLGEFAEALATRVLFDDSNRAVSAMYGR